MTYIENGQRLDAIRKALINTRGVVVVGETVDKPRVDGRKGMVYKNTSIAIAPEQGVDSLDALNAFAEGLLPDTVPVFRHDANAREDGEGGIVYGRLKTYDVESPNVYRTTEVVIFPNQEVALQSGKIE